MDSFFKDTTLATVEVLLPVWREPENHAIFAAIPGSSSMPYFLSRCFKKELVMPLDLLLMRGPAEINYGNMPRMSCPPPRDSMPDEFLFTFKAAGNNYTIRRLFMNKNNILTVLLIGIHPQLDRIDLDATLATERWKIAEDVCI